MQPTEGELEMKENVILKASLAFLFSVSAYSAFAVEVAMNEIDVTGKSPLSAFLSQSRVL